MLLVGFPVAGGQGMFPALRPEQVAIGLPGSTAAAGRGFVGADVVDAALRVHALVTPHDAVDDRIADAVRSVDATDLEARRAASRRESWQADASHPPTAMRVDHLARRGALTPMVTVSDAERAALAEETTRLLALTRNALVARHLALIHG